MVSFWTWIRFPFQRKGELYCYLHRTLGFRPVHLEYYRTALLHKSLSYCSADGRYVNNERLEYLGDAIIEAVVSDIVYRKFARAGEGFLTTTRSKIVQRSSLNELSRKIGLDKMVDYDLPKESQAQFIGGNAFEALVGAIYLDRGYKFCHRFINRLIHQGIINPEKAAHKEINFKSHIIEWCQKSHFECDFVTGPAVASGAPDATQAFECTLFIEGLDMGHGSGLTKKDSHQKAAQMALRKIRRNHIFAVRLLRRRMTRMVIADCLSGYRAEQAVH